MAKALQSEKLAWRELKSAKYWAKAKRNTGLREGRRENLMAASDRYHAKRKEVNLFTVTDAHPETDHEGMHAHPDAELAIRKHYYYLSKALQAKELAWRNLGSAKTWAVTKRNLSFGDVFENEERRSRLAAARASMAGLR